MTKRIPESPWQLYMGFDDPQPAETIAESPSRYPVRRGLFTDFDQREPGLGRFVRRIHEGTPARSPVDVAAYLMQHIYTPWEDFTQEEFYTLMLDNRNRPTHAALVYRGTVNSVHIRTAEVFRPAIQVNASTIIMAHQHPSGDPEPSPEDIRASSQIAEASRLLDIELLDSIILGKDKFVSLRERALLGV
ncbi:MAG: hypothetical protein KDE50_00870 [Caldilineaceae bacterium]|nr:hypothetical protein [Caldilineaceae bacterium]MCB0138438.1 hypothetical protein [Caldilineaceae bacterium]